MSSSSTSTLLQSSALVPLLTRSLDQEEDTTSDLFNLVVISPCQTYVSNDPDGEVTVERTPCDITSFECVIDTTTPMAGDATSGTDTAPTVVPSRITVDFDYELWYTENETNGLNTTLLQLESSMLQHLAKVFDLLECPQVTATSGSSNVATSKRTVGGAGGLRHRRRHLQVFDDELADLFVGVDSTPLDEPDNSVDECIVPVLATDTVQAVCQPMKGHFSASVNADVSEDSLAEASIKSGLLRLLRLGMNEDFYVLNDVRKVSFIGDRTTYVPPPPAAVNVSSSGGGSGNNGGIGTAGLAIIILVAIFVFLVGGFLVGRTIKKRRREQQHQAARGEIVDGDLALDEEMTGTSYSKGIVGANIASNVATADVDGSLASTDELALQPQGGLIQPVLTKSVESSESLTGEESSTTSGVTSEDTSEASPETSSSSSSAASATANDAPTSKPANSAAAEELKTALLLASAAAASAEKAGEEVTGEKLNGRPVEINKSSSSSSSPRKRRRRKKSGRRIPNGAPDSPDSLLVESLRQLDSIAEEGESLTVDESAGEDTGTTTRSLS